MWVCHNCGNTENFRGYQHVTEFCTEDIYVNADGSIEDYGDKEVNDSEVTETNIETCDKCKSDDIENLPESEFKNWEEKWEDGQLVKNRKPLENTKDSKLTSVDKLRLLADDLLNGTISITEYRQRKTVIYENDKIVK